MIKFFRCIQSSFHKRNPLLQCHANTQDILIIHKLLGARVSINTACTPSSSPKWISVSSPTTHKKTYTSSVTISPLRTALVIAHKCRCAYLYFLEFYFICIHCFQFVYVSFMWFYYTVCTLYIILSNCICWLSHIHTTYHILLVTLL